MNEKKEILSSAKKFSKWFEIDLTIKIFGVTIFHWHYPPQDNDVPSENPDGVNVEP